MKKILNIILVLFIGILISCHPTKNLVSDNQDIQYGMSMYNAYEKEFTKIQFDSICKADRISNNLNKWHTLYIVDYENGSPIIEYMYIKYQKNIEYIYRLIKKSDNRYKITKRVRE